MGMYPQWVAAALWLAGCSFDASYGDTRFRCVDDRGCPAGTLCSDQGFCEDEDGGGGDSGPGEQIDSGAIEVPPSLIQQVVTSWTIAGPGASKQTGELDVRAGDVLVAYGIAEDNDVALGSISGGEQDWGDPLRASGDGHPWVGVWTATVDADRTMTVTFTLEPDASGLFGGGVMLFRRSNGLGAGAARLGSDGPAQLSLDTAQPHSAVVVVAGDWSAQDGAQRVWREDAGALDEAAYFNEPSAYTVYAGVHLDAGPPARYQVGLLSPGNQVFGVVAVEVLGGSAD